jgi:hypothetical protein
LSVGGAAGFEIGLQFVALFGEFDVVLSRWTTQNLSG